MRVAKLVVGILLIVVAAFCFYAFFVSPKADGFTLFYAIVNLLLGVNLVAESALDN
jgi:hypothetical protein